MKFTLNLIANTFLVVALAAFVAACTPDPTANKDAATVSDEVVVDDPAEVTEDGATIDMPETEETTDEMSSPDEIAEAPDAEVEAPAAPEAAAGAETVYAFDTGSSAISFMGSKVTGTHSGGWSEYTGTVKVPNGDFTKAAINVEIDMTSTFSDDADLTEKLKSADFFEVETYPTAKFVSTKNEQSDAGYNVSGNLTLHGITKNLTFPAKVTLTDDKLTTEAEFSFDRKIFDINYDGMANDLIRDNVLMTFYIEANAK